MATSCEEVPEGLLKVTRSVAVELRRALLNTLVEG